MRVRPLRSEADHARALEAVEALWGSPAGSPEGDALDVLAQLVAAYEKARHPIEPPTLAGAIRARIEDGGVPRAEFERVVGGPAALDAILGGEREPSLAAARVFVERLGIPAASILPERSVAA